MEEIFLCPLVNLLQFTEWNSLLFQNQNQTVRLKMTNGISPSNMSGMRKTQARLMFVGRTAGPNGHNSSSWTTMHNTRNVVAGIKSGPKLFRKLRNRDIHWGTLSAKVTELNQVLPRPPQPGFTMSQFFSSNIETKTERLNSSSSSSVSSNW